MVAPFGDIGLENGSFPFFRLGDAEKYMYHRDFRRPPCDTKIFWGGATTPQAIHQSSRGECGDVSLDVPPTPWKQAAQSPAFRQLIQGPPESGCSMGCSLLSIPKVYFSGCVLPIVDSGCSLYHYSRLCPPDNGCSLYLSL